MSGKESDWLTQSDIHESHQHNDCLSEWILLREIIDFDRWRKKCYRNNQLVEKESSLMNNEIGE